MDHVCNGFSPAPSGFKRPQNKVRRAGLARAAARVAAVDFGGGPSSSWQPTSVVGGCTRTRVVTASTCGPATMQRRAGALTVDAVPDGIEAVGSATRRKSPSPRTDPGALYATRLNAAERTQPHGATSPRKQPTGPRSAAARRTWQPFCQWPTAPTGPPSPRVPRLQVGAVRRAGRHPNLSEKLPRGTAVAHLGRTSNTHGLLCLVA